MHKLSSLLKNVGGMVMKLTVINLMVLVTMNPNVNWTRFLPEISLSSLAPTKMAWVLFSLKGAMCLMLSSVSV